MELNGAVPDHILWPLPGEIPAGIDKQLEKAVAVLREELAANPMEMPPLVYAADFEALKETPGQKQELSQKQE
jgi:hypothetical protein